MTIPITSAGDTWISTLTDPTISAEVSGFAATGSLTYGDLVEVLTTVVSGGTVTTAEFNDLQTIAANLNSGLATPDDVASEFIQLADGAKVDSNMSNYAGGTGSEANQYWTGGSSSSTALGDLKVGTTSGQLTELIEKWFVGGDMPNPTDYYQPHTTVVYQASHLPLYGSSGSPQIGDISQGDAGDCEVCAGLIEVIQNDPSAIQSMIVPEANGVYGVRFYVDGNEMWVTVNDQLPNYTGSEGGGLVYMNEFNSSNPLWPDLVEKAYAELSATGLIGHPGQNSYNNISVNGNQADDVLPNLTDTSVSYFNYYDSNWSDDKELFIQAIAAGDDVILESSGNTYSGGKQELVSDHAFAVIGYDASTGDFIVRNPWGTQDFSQNYVTQFEVSMNDIVRVQGDVAIANTASSEVEILTAPEGWQNSSVYSAPEYVVAGASVAIASLFSVIDTAGSAISEYMIQLVGAGQIELNGAANLATGAQTAQGEIVVSAADLTKITYVPGSGEASPPESGNAHLLVSAYDGTAWSPTTDISLSIGSEPIAVTPAINTVLAPSERVAADSLFSGLGPVSGYDIENVGGGSFSATQFSSAALASVTYTAPSTPGLVTFDVSDYDNSGDGSYLQSVQLVVGYSVAAAIQNYDNGELSAAVAVADSAANIFANLDGLQTMLSAGVLQGVVVTDSTKPTETITSAQQADDAGVLSLLAGQVNLNVTTSAFVWAGANSGDFAVAANWNKDAVPGPDDEADISPAGIYTVSSSEDETVGTLTTESDATLDITGGVFNITSGTGSGATDGTIIVRSGAVLALGGGFRNSGTVETLGGTIEISGTVSGPGSLSIGSGVLELLGSGAAGGFTVSSGGLVELGAGAKLSGYAISSGVTVEAVSGGSAVDATVESGGMLELVAGGSESGVSIDSGGILAVGSGAALSGFGVSAGAMLEAASNGALANTTVLSGGTAVISSGGTAGNTTVSSGGVFGVFAGGVADPTRVLAGGTESVGSGGTDSGAQISGGAQEVYGLATGATAFSGGTQVVGSGGIASGTIVSRGGILELLSGGSAPGAAIVAGGTQEIASGAVASGTVVGNGATLEVETGASASATTVLAGGRLIVAAGGVDDGATVSSGGSEIVGSGGTDSATTMLKGAIEIVSGGTASGAIVSSGGTLALLSGGVADAAAIYGGGTEIVSSGGTDDGAQISGGIQLVLGLASGVGIIAGTQAIGSGGIASNTTLFGGSEIISARGSDLGARISGGTQFDYGLASGSTDFGGTQMVESGGVASGMILSGGSEVVSAHGRDVAARISGGAQLVYGFAGGATVQSGGSQTVKTGGTASATVVSSGGSELVSSGGSSVSAGIAAGGAESVFSRGVDIGAAIGDGGTQNVSASGTARSASVSSGGSEVVFFGGLASGAVISSGGFQIVEGGGTASNTTISSGGTLLVSSGGLADPTKVVAGGTEIVSAGGSDKGALIFGEQDVYGVAGGATLSSGGSQIVEAGGTAAATTVSSGALLDNFGTASGAAIKAGGSGIIESAGAVAGTLTVSSGGVVEVLGAALAQGHLNVLSGGTAELGANAIGGLTVSKGGVEIILSGGTASGGAILAGGTGILESGGQTFDTGNGSTNLNVNSGGIFEFVDVDLTATGAGAGIYAKAGAIIELVSGSIVSGQTVSGFTAKVFSGSTASAMAVAAHGVLAVLSSGSAGGSLVSGGGTEVVSSGGLDSGTTISFGGTEIVSSGGTALSATVASGGHLIVLSGGSAVDATVMSGGSAVVSAGGVFDVPTATAESGSLSNAGTVNVSAGATLTLIATTLSNSRAINLLGSAASTATLRLDANLTLTGGGTVSLAGDGSNVIDPVALPSMTLTNVNNTIVGGGQITSSVTLINSGTVNANDSGSNELDIFGNVVNHGTMEGTSGGALYLWNGGTNAKTLEATTSGSLTIDGGTLVNSATIEALSGGTFQLLGGTIDNTAHGVISVGGGASAELQGAITSGTLRAASGGEFAIDGAALFTSVSLAKGTLIEVTGGNALTLAGRTTNSGTVAVDSGGSAIVSSTLVNSGAVIASAGGSVVDVSAGAVVGGGSALQIGNGVVEVGSGGSAHVAFSAGGSGGLVLDGTGAIAVVVSGFGVSGTTAHADHSEYIDFGAFGSGATFGYAAANSRNTSGTLTVSSGASSASIILVGSYTSANFSAGTAADGSFEITDPAVVGGGIITSGAPEAFPRTGFDLPQIAFGPQTTLAFAHNRADIGGVLTMTDGASTANIALLGHYIAASFVAAGDGQGGTPLSEAGQTEHQTLTVHPHTA